MSQARTYIVKSSADIILKPEDEHDHGLFLDEFQQPVNWMLHYELLTIVQDNKVIHA